MRHKDGSLAAAWGPTSVLGEAIAKDVTVTTREGDSIHVGAFATHNPDRAVTGAVKDVMIFKDLAPIIHEGVRGGNEALIKGTKDPNVIPKDPNIIPVDPQFIPPPQ